MDESGGPDAIHVSARGDTDRAELDDSCPHSKGKYRHPEDQIPSARETLCKVVEDIINTRLKSCITFHEILHGFHAGRVIWKAILELKLSQELASIDQDPLFLVLLEIFKHMTLWDRAASWQNCRDKALDHTCVGYWRSSRRGKISSCRKIGTMALASRRQG